MGSISNVLTIKQLSIQVKKTLFIHININYYKTPYIPYLYIITHLFNNPLYIGLFKLKNKILREAKNAQKSHFKIKKVFFECF